MGVDFDALGECAQVIAAVAAALGSHALAGLPGKRFEGLGWDDRPDSFYRTLGSLCVGVGLISDGLPSLGRQSPPRRPCAILRQTAIGQKTRPSTPAADSRRFVAVDMPNLW
ncbi:MAG TPA: hypothetical protein VGL31_20685 [Xanthobacteraceae bacterium]